MDTIAYPCFRILFLASWWLVFIPILFIGCVLFCTEKMIISSGQIFARLSIAEQRHLSVCYEQGPLLLVRIKFDPGMDK